MCRCSGRRSPGCAAQYGVPNRSDVSGRASSQGISRAGAPAGCQSKSGIATWKPLRPGKTRKPASRPTDPMAKSPTGLRGMLRSKWAQFWDPSWPPKIATSIVPTTLPARQREVLRMPSISPTRCKDVSVGIAYHASPSASSRNLTRKWPAAGLIPHSTKSHSLTLLRRSGSGSVSICLPKAMVVPSCFRCHQEARFAARSGNSLEMRKASIPGEASRYARTETHGFSCKSSIPNSLSRRRNKKSPGATVSGSASVAGAAAIIQLACFLKNNGSPQHQLP